MLCSASAASEMLRQFGAVLLRFGAFALPFRFGPDLDAVGQPDDDHLVVQLCISAQELRDNDAPELVGLGRHRAGKEVALHAAGVSLPRVERADAFGLGAPAIGVPDDEAAIEAAGDDQAFLESSAEARGYGEATLVIDGVFELTEEQRRRRHARLGPHFDPLFTTPLHCTAQPDAGTASAGQ